MSDVSLTSLAGIFSIVDALSELRDFRMLLISSGAILEPKLEEGLEMELDYKFLL